MNTSNSLAPEVDKSKERRLEVFVQKADKLLSSNIFLKGEAEKLSSGANLIAGKGIEFHANLPDEIEVEQLFTRFRPFFLKKEPSYFYSVCKIVSEQNDISKGEVEKARTLYKNAMNSTGPIEINFIGSGLKRLKSEEIINLWYNAHYFHSDKDKEEKLQNFNTVLSEDFTKNTAVLSVLLAGRAIAILRSVIKASGLLSL